MFFLSVTNVVFKCLIIRCIQCVGETALSAPPPPQALAQTALSAPPPPQALAQPPLNQQPEFNFKGQPSIFVHFYLRFEEMKAEPKKASNLKIQNPPINQLIKQPMNKSSNHSH